MTQSLRFRLSAAVLIAALFAFASCGGGGTTPAPNNGQLGNGGNQIPDENFDGPLQYDGQQQPTAPDLPDTGGGGSDPVTPNNPPFVYGNIFAVPITSNGQGRVVATTLNGDGTARLGFLPGQRVAMVMVNTNPAFLDTKYDQSAQAYPALPTSAYSFTADLVDRGASSMDSWSAIQSETQAALGRNDAYNGIISTGGTVSPSAIYEREAIARGETPYSVSPPIKRTSSIQKGELRTFVNVQPTISPPPVGPDQENPERDITGLQYPYEYAFSQDGRLVAIGAHCLIFLSKEINDGNPDTIRFTEARLNAMAQEFDTKIFPTTQAAFGPVENYNEGNIFRDLDRTVRLTGDQFDVNGQLEITLPGTVDLAISQEQRIVIFLFNSVGGGGGFYSQGLSGASAQKLMDEGRDDEIAKFGSTGSTLYIDSGNLPANDDSWTSAYSVMAHEFQHKLFADNNLPNRPIDPQGSGYNWFNEGLSMMSIHVNGYTVNSGKIVPWAINGQLTDYMANINQAPIPADGTAQLSNQWQYGGGFLFFLYLYEHYDPGVGNRIYQAAAAGEDSYTKLIEAGARQTYRDPGADGELNTADDVFKTFHDSFQELYTKFALANFIDGIYAANDSDLFDPRFHYNTIDLRGTVDLANGTVVLPGVATGVFPAGGSYPVTDIHRLVRPWAMDYLVFTNGDGQHDLSLTVYTDPNMKMFLLPCNYNATFNAAAITEGVTIPTN